MPAKLGSEQPAVQAPLIRYASEIGWSYLPPREALAERRGESGVLLYATLRRKLLDLNPGHLTAESADEVIDRIESARATIEGNAEVLGWLRGERSILVESEKRQRNVTVIDYDHLAENVFQVTDEWEYRNGEFCNRADVVFLVNGIPVAVVETKAASRPDAIDRGITQLRRYHRETPEMVTAAQLVDVTHLIDYYYGVTWNLDRKALLNWKDEEPGNFERKVKRFFGRERFLKTLKDWIVFFQRDDELQKIVLRQHQTRAVEKVVTRALDPERSRGLVWHTQGSGKTLTMITTARQLLEHPAFRGQKPTVIMLVDRDYLQAHFFANLAAVEIPYEVATSKRRLRELLASDFRGLVVSMIHKFDGADADLCTRDNVFLLVDEAHRTTGGDLGNYLVAALPNATMIGFTGTPIDRTAYGKGTFKVFGRDDARGYLDKYSIAESIEDGTTLELHYALAPNEMRVPEEQLESEFLALAEAEGVADFEELNAILERAVNLKTFLKSPARIEKVAAFAAQHFRENVEPLGYKAFLVGVDREACALYKQALDRHLPADYSAVVYSSAHNDPPLLAQFALEEDAEKQIRKAFAKRGGVPKILIVTEKLLTGFDAPVLYCMYLDKPMRDHTLLQAVARVNRPFEEDGGTRKPSGLVVDFVGIFEKLEKALAFDSDVVASVIKNIDVLKERFAAVMSDLMPGYLALCRGALDDKAAERAIDALADAEDRERFYAAFKELENLYEILSPDVFLRAYLDDYARLSTLYALIRGAFSSQPALIRDLMHKTEELVRKHVAVDGLTASLPPTTIDETALDTLKEDDSSSTAKVINLGKGLISGVSERGRPYLASIGERAQAILEEFYDRQRSAEAALAELDGLAREFLESDRERERLGLDENTFALYSALKRAGLDEAEAVPLAQAVVGAIGRSPEFRDNAAQRRQLKAELYRLLIPVVGKDAMVRIAEWLLGAWRA